VKDKSQNSNSPDVDKQIALERRSLAELLLDFYETTLAKRGGLDAGPQETTIKERSKTNAN